MVAETVKYPVNYPALIPLSPSVAGLGGGVVGGGYSCSSSLIHANYAPAHIMDQKPTSQQQQQQQQQREQRDQRDSQGPIGSPIHNGQDNTPVGLGAPGLHLPSTLELAAQLRKKEIFTQRKQREFIPDSKKDESYWDRRRRNNEAAKRSREKRRFNDMILEQRVVELSKENHILKAQLTAIKEKYGIMGENLINAEQVIANMPQTEQIIAINKRTKFSPTLMNLGSSPSVTSLLSPEGSISSPSPSISYHNPNDAPDSPQNYSHYGSHDDHDSHFDTNDQYPPTSSNDLYYRASALNLTTHTSSTSHSPLSPTTSHMEYSPASDLEMSRRSPVSEPGGSSLPHKLRHKSHLGDKDAAAQSLLALQGIKTEPHDPQQEAAEDSVGSSDERDSGISYSSSSSCSDYHRLSDNSSSSPTACLMTESSSISSSSRNHQSLHMQHYQHQQQLQHHHHQQHHQQQQQHQQHQHHHHQQQQQQQQQEQEQHHHHQQQQQQQQESEEVPEYENTHLRSELERLASEVATLKYMLVRRPRSETDSDGSR